MLSHYANVYRNKGVEEEEEEDKLPEDSIDNFKVEVQFE
jgi:hypothetical protein